MAVRKKKTLNKIHYHVGNKYCICEAVTKPKGVNCQSCAFYSNPEYSPATLKILADLCDEHACTPSQRTDNRNVIFNLLSSEKA